MIKNTSGVCFWKGLPFLFTIFSQNLKLSSPSKAKLLCFIPVNTTFHFWKDLQGNFETVQKTPSIDPVKFRNIHRKAPVFESLFNEIDLGLQLDVLRNICVLLLLKVIFIQWLKNDQNLRHSWKFILYYSKIPWFNCSC